MDNYIWAIIIVIAILMAIVGYIADKTDFGRKEFERKVKQDKPKKEKLKKEIEEVLPVVEQTPAQAEFTNEVNETPVSVNNNFSDLMIDDSTDMSVIDNMYSNDNNGDFNPELNQVEITSLNDPVGDTNESEVIDQSLFEPLPSIDQVFSEPVNNEVVVENATEEVATEATPEDDVWKF